ncbi:hypothetical protein D3C75_553630 [compost metagenome]
MDRLGLLQLLKVLALQVTSTPTLIEQALGDGGEQRTGFTDCRQARGLQQLHEGFAGNVFDSGGIVQGLTQACAEPEVVGAEQSVHLFAMKNIGAGHRGSWVRGR